MYPQTLYPKTKKILDDLKNLGFLKDWYLAGGTGLALQLGHRKSIDLDFFTDNFPKRELLLGQLKTLSPKITQETKGTLDASMGGVKVSFLEYDYLLLGKKVEYEGIKIAGVLDITCMKVTAISSRGSKKDFVDLYFVLEKYSLSEIFEAVEKKFRGVKYQKLHLLKSISYFADADKDPSPDMIKKASWEDIKKDLEKKVKEYSKKQIA
jgi:hypothetical protein